MDEVPDNHADHSHIYTTPLGPSDDELFERALKKMCQAARVDINSIPEPFFVGGLTLPGNISQHRYPPLIMCKYGRLDGGEEFVVSHSSTAELFAVWSKLGIPVTLTLLKKALRERLMMHNFDRSKIDVEKFITAQLSFRKLDELATEDQAEAAQQWFILHKLGRQTPCNFEVKSFKMEMRDGKKYQGFPLFSYDIEFTNAWRLRVQDETLSEFFKRSSQQDEENE
jgi:hypothetical protein